MSVVLTEHCVFNEETIALNCVLSFNKVLRLLYNIQTAYDQDPYHQHKRKYFSQIEACICMQGQIQDFWKGGQYV